MDTLLETLTVMHSEAPLSWLPLILIIVPAILLVAGGVYAWEGWSRKLRAEHAPRATLSALVLSLIGTGGLLFASHDSSIILSQFTTPFGMRLDLLASTMTVLVTFIGHVIVKYSVRYLNGEHRQKTFLSWLFFSLTSVLTLSLSGNLLLLTAAWTSTSLTFHRLLTYYSDRPEAIKAARKKFVISRIGDLSLLAAILLCWNYFETCDLGKIANMITQSNLSESQTLGLTMVSCLIITAAVLKSAQFPFHSWLPETMETPTPVSALMHAGMINGGGFLIIRCSHILVQVPAALTALAVMGLITGIYGSMVMLTQTSVKRSLAYSTVAQMGFMMIQCGFGAFGLAYIHLIGHAIYKAHAFLASGTLPTSVKPNLTPKKASIYGLGTFVGALIFGPVALLTLNHWTGIPLSMSPGNVLLTSVFFMSWSILVWNWWRGMDDGMGFIKTVGLGAGVIGIYAVLHLISHETFTNAFPVEYSQESWQTYSLVAVLVAILMMTAFGQILLPSYSSNHWIRKLYVHSSRGFYIAVIADKWVAWLYKDRTFFRPSRTSKTFYESDLLKPQQQSKYEYDVVKKMVEDTADKMAPLWPLKDFVAVNPFLGFMDKPYVATCEYVRNLTPGGMQMAAKYYQDKIKNEKITVDDLERGIRRAADYNHLMPPGFLDRLSAETIIQEINLSETKVETCEIETVAEASDKMNLTQWEVQIQQLISDHCTAFFDTGQANWKMPQADQNLFDSWKEYATVDQQPEWLGLVGFRSFVKHLPEDPVEVIQSGLNKFNIPENAAGLFLHKLAFSMKGWCGQIRAMSWHQTGGMKDGITAILAIRMAYEMALSDMLKNMSFGEYNPYVSYDLQTSPLQVSGKTALFYVLQLADEYSVERKVQNQLIAANSAMIPDSAPPEVQAVFCIDVRSEVIRRCLESTSPRIHTKGFAGFFGLPVAHHTLDGSGIQNLCPVLIEPRYKCGQTHDDPETLKSLRKRSQFNHNLNHGLNRFKSSAISSFSFVETLGFGYLYYLIKHTFGWKSQKGSTASFHPALESVPTDEKVNLAYGILKGMGLTNQFGRLILLCGHTSQATNNPYKSGMDCGACGGHSGEINARLVANLLNQSQVRHQLMSEYGINIPETTWFLAGLHNTTTDEVSILDECLIPQSSLSFLRHLKEKLSLAGDLARKERAPLLGIISNTSPLKEAFLQKGKDWSETRPEWGLAGNTGMIIAPRSRTQNVDLEGRMFLHEYDSDTDADSSLLELIMSAPMVVASWINLQYYASTANNESFGSGNKVLHNIAGGVGVCIGNRGDLKTGLPMQSLHDGSGWRHHPVRLHVCIEAPISKTEGILRKNPFVNNLVDNQWIHLFAIHPDGTFSRKIPKGSWNRQSTDRMHIGEMTENKLERV